VTTGTQVSLFEALETVERIREIANTNLDIKFSVSHNDQLTDQILVSIIAASFTTEKDYTTVPPITLTKTKPETDGGLLNSGNDKNNNKDDSEGGLLPEFLNDKRFN
jgi:cell division GTPase FtsZ